MGKENTLFVPSGRRHTIYGGCRSLIFSPWDGSPIITRFWNIPGKSRQVPYFGDSS